MGTVKLGRVLITVAVALASCSLALAGSARADVVDGGNLRLKPSSALAKALAREGVRLTGLKPAKGGQAGVTLPITSGLSEIQHGSGFRLRAGKRAVTVRRLVLNENEHWLRGVVNGAPETGVVSSAPIRAVLQANFAKVLNEVFRAPEGKPGLFTAGEFIGAFAYEARTR
jgi:hypothetical protein